MTPLREPDAAMKQLTEAVIGAAIEVHRALGPGLLESVYREAMVLELRERGIAFEQKRRFVVRYRETIVGKGEMDIVVASLLVVELKTVERFAPIHEAQLKSYLRAGGYHVGLLLNFNVPVLVDGIKRVVCTSP